MSLKAGRVGVNPKEVDANGNLKESSNSYSKAESDEKFETKANIGGLQFRVESVSGTAQYKTPEGDWVNFNSGSGGVGFNIPDDATPITQSMVLQGGGWLNVLEGSKYYIDNKIVYVDILFTCTMAFSSKAIIRLTVNTQPSFTSISDVSLASMCIEGSGKLKEPKMGMSGGTDLDISFSYGVEGVTFRLYGQITLID